MKKRSIITAVVLTAVISMSLTGCVNFSFGGFDKVSGNGKAATREISLSETPAGYRTVTSIDILLDPTLKDKAVLEGESNILDLVEVRTTGGVLEVDYKPHVSIFSIQPVKLRVPEISGGMLETDSSGSIGMIGNGPLKGDLFELRTNSSGSITLAVEAKQLMVRASSSGSINVKGSAETGEIDLSSSGSFNGFDCKMQAADVRVSSSGTAQVYVSGELTGNTGSSGDIIYDGNPGKVNASSGSSGRVMKR